MPDTSQDPIDYSRTHRPRMGESLKDTTFIPGYVGVAVAVLLLVCGLAAAAAANGTVAVSLFAGAVLVGGVAGGWLYLHRRRNAKRAAAALSDRSDAP
ncbi:LapA family protein [Mycobacterium sp. MYCO198283]|uniref:LapA family protein n=1 Tax=Mycobacterium sp. MYCO198283 TaxID=2883505 RepID=UPI001E507772|nr:LapA family protein [Mycobacterium sp. MYCO198283]MCG5431684.1 LapA family protein [Mycobacterium sp. MYCO198283]